jgi:sugar phosphate isomerase/epimerase
MSAPAVLIWDGRVPGRVEAARASDQLAECIGRARELAGPATLDIAVSAELHPFTFALKYGHVEDLATALPRVGAGICIDFCHFSVAQGGDFQSLLTDSVIAAVNEIHYCDSDGTTSEFHFPPGRGSLDLAALEERFRGRGLVAGLDLFQWPAPRSGARDGMSWYKRFVIATLTFTQRQQFGYDGSRLAVFADSSLSAISPAILGRACVGWAFPTVPGPGCMLRALPRHRRRHMS